MYSSCSLLGNLYCTVTISKHLLGTIVQDCSVWQVYLWTREARCFGVEKGYDSQLDQDLVCPLCLQMSQKKHNVFENNKDNKGATACSPLDVSSSTQGGTASEQSR